MKDKFTKKALNEGYLARSIYKLKDIDKRYKLIKKDMKVLDLGASPGSWSEYSRDRGSEVTSVDLNKINVSGINIINLDIFDEALIKKLKNNYDLILSDLAPKTIGVLNIDNERSYDLCKRALMISKKKLKKNGNFLCKIFQSRFSEKLLKELRKEFRIVKTIKPEASKKRSKEIYFLGINKLRNP